MSNDLRFYLNALLAPARLDATRVAILQGWIQLLEIDDLITKNLIHNLRLVPKVVSGPFEQSISINSSPTFALAGLTVHPRHQESFDIIAANFLRQVAKLADQLVRFGQKKTLIRYKSAARNAAYAISRLQTLTESQLTEVKVRFASAEKNSLDILINDKSFEHVASDLKLMRSLQNLAYGHRSLRFNAGQESRKPIQRGLTEEVSPEDKKNGILKVIHEFDDYEADQDEDTPPEVLQIKLVLVSLPVIKKSLQLKFPKRTISNAEQFARANQIAKHRARSNQFSITDKRCIEAGLLEKVDNFIRTTTDDQALAAVLLPLLTGRMLVNIDREIFCNAPFGQVGLSANVPKVAIPDFAIKTLNFLVVPVPNGWANQVQRVKSFLKNHEKISLTVTLRKILKSIDSELNETKLRHFLPIQLRLSFNAEFLAALVCDFVTSIDLTKTYYFCVATYLCQEIFANLWSQTAEKLGHLDGTQLICFSSEMLGTPNCPDFSQLVEWQNIESKLDPDLKLRQSLYEESKFLAYRAVKDPQPELIHAGGIQVALINDKNRGGSGQMSRLIPLEKSQVLYIKKHDDLARKNRMQIISLPKKQQLIDARTVLCNEKKPITPKAFTKSEPALPGAANAGRKFFINNALGVPSEFLSAQVGWASHGLVSFSIFSSLSPIMMYQALGKK